MRKPFLVCWKRDTPPWFTKFEFKKFFSLFYIISTQRSYIYKKKLDTNSCFAKLRAISNLFSFFLYTLMKLYYFRTAHSTKSMRKVICESSMRAIFELETAMTAASDIILLSTEQNAVAHIPLMQFSIFGKEKARQKFIVIAI